MSTPIKMYVDESMIEPGVVLIALVSVDNNAYEQYIGKKIASRTKTDLYRAHEVQLHYAEDTKSIQSDIAAWVLGTGPMSAYFLIKKVDLGLDEHTAKQEVYQDAFPKLLLAPVIEKYRKSVATDVEIEVAFENLTDNFKADQVFFESCVQSLGYKNVSVRVINDVSKTFLPDYMAGIIRSHIIEGPLKDGKRTESAKKAEIIQDKIGLIVFCDANGKCSFFERGEEVRELISSWGTKAGI